MEVLTKLRTIVPCGVRLMSIRYTSSSNNKSTPSEEEAQPGPLPFSRDGDGGCSLVNNVKISKDNRILDAIGNTDELMSQLGVARENAISSKHPYIDKLTRIQTMLVDIIIAISKQDNSVAFPQRHTQELEEWIVKYSRELHPPENYLLPGGGKVATSLHVARTVCRRAERSIYPLVKDGQLDQEIQVYFNRLSDLLFTWARFAAKKDERSESVYTPKSEAKKQIQETKKFEKDQEKKDIKHDKSSQKKSK